MNTPPTILLIAPNIPQVYVALALLPPLQRQFAQAAITVLTAEKHFHHFQENSANQAVSLCSEWPTSLTDFAMRLYVGHSYFLHDEILAQLAPTEFGRQSNYWLNAHFEAQDVLRWRQHGTRIGTIFQGIFCEDIQAQASLLELGLTAKQLHVVGNAKYDCCAASDRQIDKARQVLARMPAPAGKRRVIVAASLAQVQEMALFVQAFVALLPQHPELLLVLAPRCPEAIAEFTTWLAQRKLAFHLSSAQHTAQGAILLLDEVGVLKGYYACADLALVGRSFYASDGGGSNFLEPAAVGLPIICGPYMAGFHTTVLPFLAKQALLQLQEAQQLHASLTHLLADAAAANRLGQRAKALIGEQAGALLHSIHLLIHTYHHA